MAWYQRFAAMAVSTAILASSAIAQGDFVPEGPRSEKAIKGGKFPMWPERPDQADVVTASYVGGKGTEWLVGGAFLPDKTLVLAGNIAGGVFDLGVRPTVLGTDGAAPGPVERAKNKKGELQPYSWGQSGVTGFLVRMSPDYKQIVSVSRLPWDSASITSILTDAEGSIYIAGKATEKVKAIAGPQQDLPVDKDTERKNALVDFTFIAKLSGDAGKVLWLRTARGLSDAPRLSMKKDGTIIFASQDVKTLDSKGNVLSTAIIPGGVRETSSVNPIDGTIVKGGEHHWGTGREPWRCPILNVHEPSGKLRYQFYDWGGPYVGLDNCRAVSDSAVRLVQHDKEGNVFFFAWSDGGNSVMTAQPQDVRMGVGLKGTGLNAAGASVSSFGYLVKLEPKDYRPIGYTFWCAHYAGKPNGISVNNLGQTDDGSLAISGGSAWGFRQTPNFIGKSEPAGNYIAVLTPDMSGVRFASAIPGVGLGTVGNDASDAFGINAGTVDGKAMVLFTAGAGEKGNTYDHVAAPPMVKAAQEKFGGGDSDGWFVVLDLSKGTVSKPPAEAPRQVKRLTVESLAQRVDPKKQAVVPAEGANYQFSPAYPKYVTVDAEFRDAKGEMWPSFAYGKPVSGSITMKDGKVQGSFVVACDKWCQPNGSQARRVMGQHVQNGQPPVRLTVKSLGEPRTQKFESKNDKGQVTERVATTYEADAVLEIGGFSKSIKPQIALSFNAGGRDGSVVGVRGTAVITMKGADFGLTGQLAKEDVDMRITFQGYDKK